MMKRREFVQSVTSSGLVFTQAQHLGCQDGHEENLAQRQEQALRLSAALAELPDAQREALMLRHFHDWSLAQIAQHLDRSHAAVAGLLKRGLQQLRNQLRDCE